MGGRGGGMRTYRSGREPAGCMSSISRGPSLAQAAPPAPRRVLTRLRQAAHVHLAAHVARAARLDGDFKLRARGLGRVVGAAQVLGRLCACGYARHAARNVACLGGRGRGQAGSGQAGTGLVAGCFTSWQWARANGPSQSKRAQPEQTAPGKVGAQPDGAAEQQPAVCRRGWVRRQAGSSAFVPEGVRGNFFFSRSRPVKRRAQ